MFIISMAMIVGGYVILYYGYSMYQAYKANDPTTGTGTTGGVTMSFLLGLSDISNYNKTGSKPPFNLGGSSGAQPASSTTGTTGGSGVQAV